MLAQLHSCRSWEQNQTSLLSKWYPAKLNPEMKSQSQTFGAQSRGGAQGAEFLIWAEGLHRNNFPQLHVVWGFLFFFLLNCLLWQQGPPTAPRASSSWCRQEGTNPEIPAKLPCSRPQKAHRMYLQFKTMFLFSGKNSSSSSCSIRPCQVLWGQLLWDLGTQMQL